MLWKKLPATIWNPTMGNRRQLYCIPTAAISIIFSSEVKMRATYSGTNSPMKKAAVVTTVAQAMVILSTWVTRS